MERQDQRGVLGNHQRLRRDVDALCPDRRDLAHEVPRIENHAIPDHGQLAATNHTRRERMQFVDLAIDDQCVPGIVAALKAADHIRALAQPVDDLALAFVTPLGADNHNVGHASLSSHRCRAAYSRHPVGAKPKKRHATLRRARHLALEHPGR